MKLTRPLLREMIKEELHKILVETDMELPDEKPGSTADETPDSIDWMVDLVTTGPRWIHQLRTNMAGHPAILELLDFVENKVDEMPLLFELLDSAIPDLEVWKLDAVFSDLHQTGALMDAYDGAGRGENGSRAMADLIKARYQYM